MERNIKNQKGITLVALVITIIVMLILVAVSVTVAINGGLFTKAKEAGNEWEDKSAEEAAGNIINVDNQIMNIDSAINTLQQRPTTPAATTISFTIQGFGWDPQASDFSRTFEIVDPNITTWAQWIDANSSVGLTYSGDSISHPDYGVLYVGEISNGGANTSAVSGSPIQNGQTYTLSQV